MVRVRAREVVVLAKVRTFTVRQGGSRCWVCLDRVARGSFGAFVGGGLVHWSCVDVGLVRVRERAALGRTQRRREVFWRVGCPECGVGAGVACVEAGGVREANHRGRMFAYSALKREGSL